ncbi:TolC family protein [Thiomicrospira pelophila]|uniref:TolC family protein n=1 Tax=Thiomicrospira pelophila TaxID=934 RepID=UPI0004A71070|nr:TolC family protein [Thiomicrospira pelophila]
MPQLFVFITLMLLSSAQAASLGEWVERLAQNQPEALRMEAQQAWAQAQTQQAKRWFPQGGQWRVAHETDQMTGSQGIQNWEVGVGFSLWAWGQRQAQQDYAQFSQQNSELSQSLLKLDMAEVLREAAWNLRQSKAELEMAQREHQVWQQLTEGVSKAVRAGEKPQLDQKLAEQALLRSEANLAQTQAKFNQAQALLQSWGVDSEIEALTEPQAKEDWQNHPALIWQRNLAQQAQAKRRIAESEVSGQPSIELTAKQEQDDQTQANGALVLAFSMPFGEGNRVALADSLQNQTEQQVALATLKRQIHQAWLSADNNLKLARQQNGLAQKQVEMSRQTLVMARQSYQSGETNLTELLRVQQQTLFDERQAVLSSLDVQYQIARFNQALGVVPQ